MKVLFVAGFGPISAEPHSSKEFYVDALGLALEPMPDNPDYRHTEQLDGVKHFAVWPLEEAAKSCFGTDSWPADVSEPRAWLEFDVEDVNIATAHLQARGHKLLVESRTEPWGQIVSRLLSPEGILVGLTFTPWLRR
jgi:hypothetical protein